MFARVTLGRSHRTEPCENGAVAMTPEKRKLRKLTARVLQLEQSEAKLTSYTQELERLANAHTLAIQATRDVAVFALAKLADSRDPDTGEHLRRIRDYAQMLGRHLSM